MNKSFSMSHGKNGTILGNVFYMEIHALCNAVDRLFIGEIRIK